jgi:hypothetical protein
MHTKLINAAMLATALALGGTAGAQGTGGMNAPPQKTQPSKAQQPPAAAQPTRAELAVPALKAVRLSSLDEDQLKDVQKQLKEIGLYEASVDGVLGRHTRAALVTYFQRQLALAQQGRISEVALTGFGFDENEIQKVRGVDEAKSSERETLQGHEGPATPEQKTEMKQEPQKKMEQQKMEPKSEPKPEPKMEPNEPKK